MTRPVSPQSSRLRVKLLLVSSLVLFSCSLLFDSKLPDAPRAPAIGAAAPDFALPDQSGEIVSSSSLRGRQIVLVFYRGFW